MTNRTGPNPYAMLEYVTYQAYTFYRKILKIEVKEALKMMDNSNAVGSDGILI